jgi:hypothetical protein
MSYYDTINKAYVNQKKLYMYDNYNDSIITYELLLKIISYNDNNNTKFDIFYKKHMANFKLTQHYNIYHIQKEPFNSFINSEDFITTVGKIIWWYSYKNFCKEIHTFLTDIIKIIEEEEVKNKLINANDIITEKPLSLFYNKINEVYIKLQSYSYKDCYSDNRIKTYELLLKIISYNDNDDTKFDIFYKKHMANFKLSKYYYINYMQKQINLFVNSEDFINIISKMNIIYYKIDFIKEIYVFLTDIIKIIENEEELKNKLNASIVANDIINNIFPEVIKDIPEKQPEENKKLKEYEEICKVLKNRGFNNTLSCMRNKAQELKNKSIDNKKPILKEIEPIKTKKKPISATMKRLVWNKWIGEEIGKAKCLCCNLTAITQLSFNCGHIIAEFNGGETTVSNLKPICQNCNSSMRTKNMQDFMQTLK